MGRLLVWVFLGTLAFLVLTVAIGIIHLLRDLLELIQFIAPSKTIANYLTLPNALSFNGIWFVFAIYYFFIFVPAVLAFLLLMQFVNRHVPTKWKTPPTLDWAQEKVAVVLTAYNDEKSIGPSVDEFRPQPGVAHVIVVDNNSRDRTTEVAREHGALVVKETNQGYGHACMSGLRWALENTEDEIIVLCEGDMTFFGDDLPKLLPYIADCDMVVGTRNTKTLTKPGSQMDWFMSWGNLLLALLIRFRYWDWAFLGRVQLTDVGCTFRAIRRDALARIMPKLTVGGHHFSPHMILVALRERLAVVEVPIKFRQRVGVSKGAGGNRWRAIGVGIQMVASIAIR